MIENKSKEIASLRNVCKNFSDKNAVVDINMNLFEGEVLSILGPNGAGKTTLINMMLGRLSVSTGSISILGYQPGELELKRQCGAMLQVSGLPDMSTVKEHIQLFQSYYANPMPYKKVIQLAQLTDIENEYSKNLSGGQKQRLLFGLSICGNPKLLFLDEPSVGLDIEARKSLWCAITELKTKGTSIILTTHYLEEADQLSDRIIILNKGRIIQQGTPNEIKSRINRKKIRFTSSLSHQELQSFNIPESIDINGHYFEIQSNQPDEILRLLFRENVDISDLSITGAALEDAFLLLNEEVKANEAEHTE